MTEITKIWQSFPNLGIVIEIAESWPCDFALVKCKHFYKRSILGAIIDMSDDFSMAFYGMGSAVFLSAICLVLIPIVDSRNPDAKSDKNLRREALAVSFHKSIKKRR